MAREPRTPNQKRVRLQNMVMGLVVILIMLPVAFYVVPPLMPPKPRRIDDALALMAAFMLLPVAIVAGISHLTFPKDAPVQRQRFAQVMNSAFGGLVLLLPVIGGRFIDPTVNFAIVVALTAAGLFTNWLIWRAADELMRSVMKDTWIANFFISMTLLTIYGAGERLGVLGGATAWGALGLVTIVSFGCSVLVVVRRGMDRPPRDD